MAAKKGSYQVYSDQIKNRIYIFFMGYMPDEMVKKAVDKIVEEVPKLRQGFDVITDIATFVATTRTGTEEIKRGQDFINNHGVRRIVRVVDMKGNLISSMQFDRLSAEHYDQKVRIAHVGSVEEADKLLDNTP